MAEDNRHAYTYTWQYGRVAVGSGSLPVPTDGPRVPDDLPWDPDPLFQEILNLTHQDKLESALERAETIEGPTRDVLMDEILYLKMCLRVPIRARDLAGTARTYIRRSSLADRLVEEFDSFLRELEPVLPSWDEILAGGYPWNQLTSWSEFRGRAYRDFAAFGHPSWPRGRLFVWHPDLGGSHAQAIEATFSEALTSAENAFRVARGLPTIGQGWLSEAALLHLVRSRFPDTVAQWSPFWLGGQRVDIYVPSLNLAIEYQGEQHYRAVALFGGEEGLKATRARDERKRRLLARRSVSLFEWRFDRPITEAELDRALTDLV